MKYIKKILSIILTTTILFCTLCVQSTYSASNITNQAEFTSPNDLDCLAANTEEKAEKPKPQNRRKFLSYAAGIGTALVAGGVAIWSFINRHYLNNQLAEKYYDIKALPDSNLIGLSNNNLNSQLAEKDYDIKISPDSNLNLLELLIKSIKDQLADQNSKIDSLNNTILALNEDLNKCKNFSRIIAFLSSIIGSAITAALITVIFYIIPSLEEKSYESYDSVLRQFYNYVDAFKKGLISPDEYVQTCKIINEKIMESL